MDAAEIKQLVEAGIAGAEVQVAGAGDRFDLSVIADSFAGQSPVKRQQAVYACIKHLLDAGQIHAVNMQTYTREQWQTASRRGLV
jgi:acid stress-induced BolA-like protein IbaG/YrbA